MKPLSIFLLLLIPFCLFGQDDGGSSEISINEKWIKDKQMLRKNFKRGKLAEIDARILEQLESKAIPEEHEKFLSELVSEIINDNRNTYYHNSIKAFKILETKFSNKKNFFDVAAEFAFRYGGDSPFVVAQIFDCMSRLLEGHYDENMDTLKVVYESIKHTYLYQAKNGTIHQGTKTVVEYLIEYLRKYVKAIEQGKIRENLQKKWIIVYIYRDLDLDNYKNNITKYKGVEELKKEYFFFRENAPKDTEEKKSE